MIPPPVLLSPSKTVVSWRLKKNTDDKGGFNLVADYLLNDTNYYLRHAAAVPKQDRKPVRLFDKFLKK